MFAELQEVVRDLLLGGLLSVVLGFLGVLWQAYFAPAQPPTLTREFHDTAAHQTDPGAPHRDSGSNDRLNIRDNEVYELDGCLQDHEDIVLLQCSNVGDDAARQQQQDHQPGYSCVYTVHKGSVAVQHKPVGSAQSQVEQQQQDRGGQSAFLHLEPLLRGVPEHQQQGSSGSPTSPATPPLAVTSRADSPMAEAATAQTASPARSPASNEAPVHGGFDAPESSAPAVLGEDEHKQHAAAAGGVEVAPGGASPFATAASLPAPLARHSGTWVTMPDTMVAVSGDMLGMPGLGFGSDGGGDSSSGGGTGGGAYSYRSCQRLVSITDVLKGQQQQRLLAMQAAGPQQQQQDGEGARGAAAQHGVLAGEQPDATCMECADGDSGDEEAVQRAAEADAGSGRSLEAPLAQPSKGKGGGSRGGDGSCIVAVGAQTLMEPGSAPGLKELPQVEGERAATLRMAEQQVSA